MYRRQFWIFMKLKSNYKFYGVKPYQCRTVVSQKFYSYSSNLEMPPLPHTLFKYYRSRKNMIASALGMQCKVTLHTNQDRTESFPEQQFQLHTCKELYKKWIKQKKFHSISEEGVVFNVKFIDTGANQENEQPVALCVHGAPGSYSDFQHLTASLHRNGVRVVAPNLPDFNMCKPWEFRQTSEEKAEFIKDFLQKLKIEKIDLLVSHSSAIFPSLLLCLENNKPAITSLVLLSPGHYTKTRGLSYYPMLKWFLFMSDYPFGYMLLKKFGVSFMKLGNPAVSLDSGVNNPLLSIAAMIRGEFWKSKEQLEKLKEKKFPILLAFGENDKLVQKEKFYDLAELFGFTTQDVWHYDKDGTVKRKGKEKNGMKVMAFQKGSHYVLWKHPDIVEDAILRFLNTTYGHKLESNAKEQRSAL